MHLGSDSCDACWVLLTEIFCCGSFSTVFTDKRDTHVLLQSQSVALLLVNMRIITSLLSDDESKPFLHVEILSSRQDGFLLLASVEDGKETSYLDSTELTTLVRKDGFGDAVLLANFLSSVALLGIFQDE